MYCLDFIKGSKRFMQMPAALPEEFAPYASAETEQGLIEMLSQNGLELARFFSAACNDETWCAENREFTSWALFFLTKLSIARQLSQSEIAPVAEAIEDHIKFLEPYLPLDVTCKFYSGSDKINSLMFSAKSSFFSHAIYRNCYEKEKNEIVILRIDQDQFDLVKEYVYTGDVESLVTLSQKELETILEIADRFELTGFSELCQKFLLRFIYFENAFPTLIAAWSKNWTVIKEQCREYINNDDPHLQISFPGRQFLACRLDGVSVHVIDNFKKLAPLITHLSCGRNVLNNPIFPELLAECSKLISLDIGSSDSYVEGLSGLSHTVKELLMPSCEWLNDIQLKKIVHLCPWVQKLDLSGCQNLTSNGWGRLLNLPNLSYLNLSRMTQLSNAEFSIVLEAARNLAELDLSDCNHLTDEGFYKIVKNGQRLEVLKLARTQITDAVIIELTFKLRSLHNLDLTRCAYLTINSFSEILRLGTSLQEVNLSNCNIATVDLEELRTKYSQVNIVA
jgi:hypothetical protein